MCKYPLNNIYVKEKFHIFISVYNKKKQIEKRITPLNLLVPKLKITQKIKFKLKLFIYLKLYALIDRVDVFNDMAAPNEYK